MSTDKQRLSEENQSMEIGVHPRSFAAENLNKLTENIIECAFEVSNGLGAGFLEKVYENALRIELRRARLAVAQQQLIPVTYRNECVGEYFADLLVEESVIIEIKCAKAFDDVHLAQCLNYLKATGLNICLLINFGKPRVEIKRVVRNY